MPGADEDQWIEWYKSLEKPLYNVVYRWLWDADESQDVVQDAFLRCWRIRHRIEPDGFKALIFRTALRLASNRARRQRIWRFVPFSTSGADADSSTEEDVLAARELRRALAGIPESLRQVLFLSEVGGLSYKEIGDVMEIREGTVGSRRSRALALLSERLAARGVEWHED